MDESSSGAGTDTAGVTQIVQRAASDWLSLRRAADEAARTTTLQAIPVLENHLWSRTSNERAVNVVDLGSGTGANLAWLSPRLSVSQRWTLVDRDEDLLDMAPLAAHASQVLDVRRLVAELDGLQSGNHGELSPDLVTCSAFLDVLTVDQVRELCAFVARSGAAALFSITVSGNVTLAPPLEGDVSFNAAFNAHQKRQGLAGPTATAIAAETLRKSGYTVVVIDTPWVLTSAESSLVKRYLSERIESVIEQDPGLSQKARDWLRIRMSQLATGALTVEVGHNDVLAFPPSPRS